MKVQDLQSILVATDAVKVYELPCSVRVVTNCLLHTADRVRFGSLHKCGDVCIYAPCVIAP